MGPDGETEELQTDPPRTSLTLLGSVRSSQYPQIKKFLPTDAAPFDFHRFLERTANHNGASSKPSRLRLFLFPPEARVVAREGAFPVLIPTQS
ncbi:hypothetical protein COP2_008071 [Malus domestica]